MATLVLLISENFVRECSSISENTSGKFILPAIREAQEIAFRNVVGTPMLARLKDLVASGEIDAPENYVYAELLERAKYYIAYSAIVEIAQKVTFKIGNAGVARTPDEKVDVVGADDLARTKTYYQGKADSSCYDLERWLLTNKDLLPELSEGCCRAIRSRLRTFATSGLWLGGPRGKRIAPSIVQPCKTLRTPEPPAPPVIGDFLPTDFGPDFFIGQAPFMSQPDFSLDFGPDFHRESVPLAILPDVSQDFNADYYNQPRPLAEAFPYPYASFNEDHNDDYNNRRG